MPARSARPATTRGLGLSLLLVALCGVVRWATSAEVAVWAFFLAPVAMVAWQVGRLPAHGIGLICLGVWFALGGATLDTERPWLAIEGITLKTASVAMVVVVVAATRDAYRHAAMVAAADEYPPSVAG